MRPDGESLLERVVAIATEAGRAALEYYGPEQEIDYKADDSPLTQADRASHESIVAALRELTPDVPVLSEESPEDEVRERKSWRRFWCVDPLDGTKEFIKQTGQFTVNIALIDGDTPTAGVVHVPVSGVTYAAERSAAGASAEAWVQAADGARTPIRVRPADLDHLTVVASRDHAGPRVKAFLERLEGAEVASMGSSLKFCLVGEGRADFYPRVVPTMEWDTAAAQCIVEVAGGSVTDLDGNRLLYNKDDLRNPSLMAFGDRDVDWVRFFAD